MKIGIVPILDPNAGGIYQYSITMLDALLKLKQKYKNNDDYYIFSSSLYHQKLKKYKDSGFYIESDKPYFFKNEIKNFIKSVIGINFSSLISNILENKNTYLNTNKNIIKNNLIQNKWFEKFKIDLMIYPAPHIWSFETKIPYIMAVHDLQHRINPQFPEVSDNGEFEEREYLYSNGIKNALMILAESKIGKEDIIKFYSENKILNKNKIKILPYVTSLINNDIKKINLSEIKKKFNLPSRFIFYPAVFWPHKNHLGIIKALVLIKQKYKLNIPIVFCGTYVGKYRKEVYKKVKDFAEKSEIDCIYLGYISDADLLGLYLTSLFLIMPTFFGPTNIPILEAWRAGCPVITSNIRGVKEQAGNAAFLVDPYSVESISEGIYKLWINSYLRNCLIKNGKKILRKYKFSDYCLKLNKVMEEAKKSLEVSI